MGFRVRPATTLFVILAVAFAFQLIAVLSVPITKKIHLSKYQGYSFGVFGLCYNGDTCSDIRIGYSSSDIEDLQGFSLPSNARHSVSKLLIVHPIATGFTLVLLIGSIVLHWHGPSSSLKFLFFLLLWTIPTFLLCLLSFLVDILLFIPHLDWGGWIVLAASVLISLSAILLCIMRRTVSSRKNMKKIGRANTFDNDGYQLRPLNYGVGTVDDMKNRSEDEEESQPFVHDTTYNTSYFNESMNPSNTNNDDLNNLQSTQPFNTMRDTPNSQYNSTNVLTPLAASYRGYEDPSSSNTPNIYEYNHPQVNDDILSPISPYDDTIQPSAPPIETPISAPYPTNIETMREVEISNTPYPTADPYVLDSPSSNLRPSGPRPMPGSSSDLQSSLNQYSSDVDNTAIPLFNKDSEFEFDNSNKPETVDRQPTFRTKIAQTLNDLQPEGMYSNSSFERTDDNLLDTDKKPSALRDVVEYDTTEESIDDGTEISTDDRIPRLIDTSSSVYSSAIPSVIPSELPTPTDHTFSINQIPLQVQQRSYQQFSSIPEGVVVERTNHMDHPLEYTLPDPNERRTTPTPSFTNESILSSTFTSVSQREINPRYLEKNNPEEYRKYLQAQLQRSAQQTAAQQQHHTSPPSNRNNINTLLESNPDFSIASSPRRRKK